MWKLFDHWILTSKMKSGFKQCFAAMKSLIIFCAQHYGDRRFSILAQDRSRSHLSILQATFIETSGQPFAVQSCKRANKCEYEPKKWLEVKTRPRKDQKN